MANNLDALLARAKSIRQDILKMTTEAGSGHPSSSLSAVEIVTALYFGGFLRHDPKNPHWPDRDRFVLSKGHAAPVLYAALAQAGYFPHDEIMSLRKLGSPLEGHPNMKRLPGVEASTGSLGQGLSIGIGHALAARIDKTNAFLRSFQPKQFNEAADRPVVIKFPNNSLNFKDGWEYLLDFALPNVYFHSTTAYAILRHCGVPVGKSDFLGAVGRG